MSTIRILMLALVFIFSTVKSKEQIQGHSVKSYSYHPVKGQCHGNPLITADGSRIDLKKLKTGRLRWIAVSRDLLRHYRMGDTVRVISEHKGVSGKWVIRDKMGPSHRMSIDFLTHPSSKIKYPRKVTIAKNL